MVTLGDHTDRTKHKSSEPDAYKTLHFFPTTNSPLGGKILDKRLLCRIWCTLMLASIMAKMMESAMTAAISPSLQWNLRSRPGSARIVHVASRISKWITTDEFRLGRVLLRRMMTSPVSGSTGIPPTEPLRLRM